MIGNANKKHKDEHENLHEEQALIRRIKKRQDRKAADQLISSYYREIYGYVFRQLGNKEAAMDITQEIFLGMIQSIWSFDPEKASFRTWLYRIATYKTTDYFRARSYRNDKMTVSLDTLKTEKEWDIPGKEDMEAEAISRQTAEEILDLLHERELILEEIFRLRFYGECTFDEIGRILDIPVSTIKSKYYGAVKAVRAELTARERREG